RRRRQPAPARAPRSGRDAHRRHDLPAASGVLHGQRRDDCVCRVAAPRGGRDGRAAHPCAGALAARQRRAAGRRRRAGMSDTIFLDALEVQAIIGIQDWEREQKQTVRIDLELPVDARAAALRDEIDATVNYKAVAKRLIAYIEGTRFQLVETLAERCAAL